MVIYWSVTSPIYYQFKIGEIHDDIKVIDKGPLKPALMFYVSISGSKKGKYEAWDEG